MRAIGQWLGWGRTCCRKEDPRTTQPESIHVLTEQADTPENRDTGQRAAGNDP